MSEYTRILCVEEDTGVSPRKKESDKDKIQTVEGPLTQKVENPLLMERKRKHG